jgi:hypothetical protein
MDIAIVKLTETAHLRSSCTSSFAVLICIRTDLAGHTRPRDPNVLSHTYLMAILDTCSSILKEWLYRTRIVGFLLCVSSWTAPTTARLLAFGWIIVTEWWTKLTFTLQWTNTDSWVTGTVLGEGEGACSEHFYTGWFKYDRDYLCVKKSQFVPVIFEPPCSYLQRIRIA